MNDVSLRRAKHSDEAQLRGAVIELQEYERRLHPTRLPGEQVADDYLKSIRQRADETGAMFVAEIDGAFAGFAAGWVEQEDNIAETVDSNRFGYISDVCVLPAYRGRRIALRLITALEKHLRTWVSRASGSIPWRQTRQHEQAMNMRALLPMRLLTRRS